MTLLTACPPVFPPANNNNAGAIPGPIQPFPPPLYGSPLCGEVRPGANVACSIFATMRNCLKNECERSCAGPCRMVYYKDGCPSSSADATRESCVVGLDCLNRPIFGGVPISQWVCDAPDANGESPYSREKNRCGAQNQPPANALRGRHQEDLDSRSSESDGWVFDEDLGSFLSATGPTPGTCVPDPDTGACPEGTEYSSDSPSPVCEAVQQ